MIAVVYGDLCITSQEPALQRCAEDTGIEEAKGRKRERPRLRSAAGATRERHGRLEPTRTSHLFHANALSAKGHMKWTNELYRKKSTPKHTSKRTSKALNQDHRNPVRAKPFKLSAHQRLQSLVVERYMVVVQLGRDETRPSVYA